MQITRTLLVSQARTWLGTSFRHQGRSKKTIKNNGGVDCLGLVIGVAKELNLKSGVFDKNNKELLVAEFDDLEYARNSDPKKLIEGFAKACIEIELNNAKIGDIILFKFEGLPKHLSIITDIENNDIITIIHSFVKVGKVTEHILDDTWKSRIARVYRLRKFEE